MNSYFNNKFNELIIPFALIIINNSNKEEVNQSSFPLTFNQSIILLFYPDDSQKEQKRFEENIGLENNSNDRGYTFYVIF
jgi:hypothetical protein